MEILLVRLDVFTYLSVINHIEILDKVDVKRFIIITNIMSVIGALHQSGSFVSPVSLSSQLCLPHHLTRKYQNIFIHVKLSMVLVQGWEGVQKKSFFGRSLPNLFRDVFHKKNGKMWEFFPSRGQKKFGKGNARKKKKILTGDLP